MDFLFIAGTEHAGLCGVQVLDKATGRFKRTLGEGSGMKEPLAVAVYGNLVAVSDTVKHRVGRPSILWRGYEHPE